MVERSERWDLAGRSEAYVELDHPADILLEVRGTDLPSLFENALFALYDQMAEIKGFAADRVETMTVRGATTKDALRSLLSEALYRFATEGFVAAGARVEVAAAGDEVEVVATLHGETSDRERHTLLAEVKAVTHHRLAVEPLPGTGWRATILLDV